MKLRFVGSGSTFPKFGENFQSNMILTSEDGKVLLIDCGTDIRHSLDGAHLSYRDIDSVYISHFHSDHVGGLEWLAFSTKFDLAARKPNLYIHPSMVKYLWEHVLSGGLQSLQQFTNIETYFTLPPIIEGKYFLWESIQFNLVKTIHVYNGSELLPSYGLFFSINGVKVFITTDTQFKPEIYHSLYQAADIIFHDCELTLKATGVHTHFTQLATLDPTIKAKIWLYHCDDKGNFDVRGHGFKGVVRRGQEFNF